MTLVHPLVELQLIAQDLRDIGDRMLELRRQRAEAIIDAHIAGERVTDIAAAARVDTAHVAREIDHHKKVSSARPNRPTPTT